MYLGCDPHIYDRKLTRTNFGLRLNYYPPLSAEEDASGAARLLGHEDVDLFTLPSGAGCRGPADPEPPQYEVGSSARSEGSDHSQYRRLHTADHERHSPVYNAPGQQTACTRRAAASRGYRSRWQSTSGRTSCSKCSPACAAQVSSRKGHSIPHQHNQQVLRRRLRGHRSDSEGPGLELTHLEAWRAEFPILAIAAFYMISNSLGAMPRQAAHHLAEYADVVGDSRRPRVGGALVRHGSSEIGNKIGGDHRCARRAPSACTRMSPRPDDCRSRAWRPGPAATIVCLEPTFPRRSISIARTNAGVRVVVVPAEADLAVRVERVLDAIDETHRSWPVARALQEARYIMDSAPVIERAHKAGALVVLDRYQSAGIVPIDVTPAGGGLLRGRVPEVAVRRPRQCLLLHPAELPRTLRPRFTGGSPIGSVRVRPSVLRTTRRCDTHDERHAGSPRLSCGTRRPRHHRRGRRRSHPREVEADDRPDPGPRWISTGFAYAVAARSRPSGRNGRRRTTRRQHVSRALKSRDFVVDYRPGVGIRVSPHFYNTMEGIERIMAEIARIVTNEGLRSRAPCYSRQW